MSSPSISELTTPSQYCCLNYLEGLEGFTMAPFTRFLGWKPEEAQVMIAQVRKEAVKRSIHAYMKGYVPTVSIW